MRPSTICGHSLVVGVRPSVLAVLQSRACATHKRARTHCAHTHTHKWGAVGLVYALRAEKRTEYTRVRQAWQDCLRASDRTAAFNEAGEQHPPSHGSSLRLTLLSPVPLTVIVVSYAGKTAAAAVAATKSLHTDSMAVLTGRMAYLLLVLVRTLCAFSPGYVHPDEWFQYGEVLAGDLMGTPSLRTWEFDPGFPCRSMASIRLFGLPIALLAWLSPTSRSPGLSLFVVQRLTFLLLSFVVDACLLTILRDFPSRVRRSALLMFASSGALFTFGMRPFSNNVEAVMLGLSLTVERKLAQSVTTTVCSRHAGRKYLHWCSFSGLLGGLIATGIFSRFTFVVFAAPIGASYLHLCFRLAKRDRQPFKRYAKQAWPAAFAFLAVCLAHIKFDTVYYNAQLSDAPHTRGLRSWYQVPVIVPINALIYNADRSNLAQHGVHPRWLHLIVNAPMVLGLGLWFFILYSLMFHSRAGKGRGGMKDESAAHRIRTSEQNSISQMIPSYILTVSLFHIVALAIIVLSLAALSVQPHQEPRFLLPLLMPASLYCSLSESWLGMSSRWRTTLVSSEPSLAAYR